MADIVNTGLQADDGTGDPLRIAFQQINQNFTQQWSDMAVEFAGQRSEISAGFAAQDAEISAGFAAQDAQIERQFNEAGMLLVRRGEWAPGVAYEATPKREWVTSGGQAYVAATNHISGGSFATDLAAGRWMAVDVAQLISSLAGGGGSALTGYIAAGVGAVFTNVQSKLRTLPIVVDEYGADPTGAVDSADAVERADAACPMGGTLVFKPNGIYSFGRTTQVKNAGKVDLQGATLKASSALTSEMIRHGEQLGSYTAISPFAVTKNQIEVTLPAGVVAPVGSLIGFNSNAVRVVSGNYLHGMWAIVSKVSGDVVTLSTPLYDGFQVDAIEVWRGYEKMEFCNGTLDLTEIAASPNFSEGLLSRGTNVYVHHIAAWGNTNAGIGIRTDGENAVIEKCVAFGFLNTPGISGGGKVGYGIAVYGNNSVIRDSSAIMCKHGLASAARTKVAVNVKYENCNVYEDPVFVSNKYSGAIDLHCNVTGNALIEDCNVICQFRALSVRCPVKILGGKYEFLSSGRLIDTFEGPHKGVHVEGIEYKMQGSSSSVIGIESSDPAEVTGVDGFTFRNNVATGTDGVVLRIDRLASLKDVEISGNILVGGGVIRHSAGNIDGLKVLGNKISALRAVVRLWMAGSLYTVNDFVFTNNNISRVVSSSAEDLFSILSTDATRITCNRFEFDKNRFTSSLDTTNSYAAQLTKVALRRASIRGNDISRGTFRNLQIGSCEFEDVQLSGNTFDGTCFFTNGFAGGTVLNRVSVIGNLGSSYTVATDLNGVTKTQYVDSGNNFAIYTP